MRAVFSIGNSSNREMEGKIYSTNRLLKVKNNAFHAPEETTVYSFDASFLKAGEVIYGELIIVSDCGEKVDSISGTGGSTLCYDLNGENKGFISVC